MKKLLFFNHLLGIAYAAFVLNNYLPTCDYALKKHDTITVVRKDWTVSTPNSVIIFNLCEPVNDGICKGHLACIKNKTDSSVKLLNGNFERKFLKGNSEHPDTDEVVLRSNNANCTLTVKWDCNLSKQDETKVEVLKDCDYVVSLFSVSNDCIRPCGAIINAQLIDLSPLKGKYNVSSSLGNFSISLCDVNTDCPNNAYNVSSCLIKGNHILPISSGSELVSYNGDSNEIKLHKKSKFDKGEKIFELFIKCNWSTKISNFHYKEAAKQGKTFKFEMESSYGCVKLPPVCEILDQYYKYNISKIYSNVGYVKVENVTGSRIILLNICGPLKLPYSADNVCTKSSSQVCEINGNEYINKGSIYTNFIPSEEKMSMSLISGSQCNSNTTYKTTIDFHCSELEDSPKFVKEENCELFLTWNTPVACPAPDSDSCKNIHNDIFECDITKTTKNYNESYDLSKLHRPNGYVVKNKNVEYHLNICGPVDDRDAPCKKNSGILAKYLDEFDIRKKVKSFGKFNKPYQERNYLVMESAGGDFCIEMNMDYKSVIQFECSEKSDISVRNSTNCTIDLLWKTDQACLNTIWSTKKCLFNHPFGDGYELDLTKLEKTSLAAKESGVDYLFDLCGNGKSQCSSNNCIYVPASKNVTAYENKTYIDFTLNRGCNKNTIFNKAKFELVCDDITENDHYVYKGIKDCTMVFQLITSQVCYKRDVIVPLVGQAADDINNYHVDTNPPSEFKSNCNVKNQYTGYQFNISLLKLNVSSSKCPDIAFNVEDQMIYLVYDLSHGCQKENGDLSRLDFRVMLKCKTDHYQNTTTNGICSQNRTFELIEACKLLDKYVINNKNVRAYSSGIIAAIVISTLVMAVLIAIFFYWLYKKMQRRNWTYGSLFASYEKDVDL
ncbi:unnamed protein product [Psylliodes chrysocephalus]|uniref:MRH domain-containing protein n=1 Tax=Psylliodes chrysocephalus TaxID=3402493 RepID=A0A9P0DD35_9CUCU|nr:unnamed protein product [Psylliodes chrysocephala]